MSVNITWSSSNGGTAITSLAHGEAAPGNYPTTQEIFIRHDGVSQISQCKFYLVGSGSNAAIDLAEILNWGDGEASSSFGGLLLNMNANGGFPSSDWPTYGDKNGTNYNVFRTGVGDSATNGILLSTEMGLSGSAGTIQTGSSPGVSFQCRIQIPSSEATTGARQFDQQMRFTFTS
jgi:hypothetical protein